MGANTIDCTVGVLTIMVTLILIVERLLEDQKDQVQDPDHQGDPQKRHLGDPQEHHLGDPQQLALQKVPLLDPRELHLLILAELAVTILVVGRKGIITDTITTTESMLMQVPGIKTKSDDTVFVLCNSLDFCTRFLDLCILSHDCLVIIKYVIAVIANLSAFGVLITEVCHCLQLNLCGYILEQLDKFCVVYCLFI